MGGYEIGSSSQEFDGVIIKVDACGEVQWAYRCGGELQDYVRRLYVADGSGVITFGGNWRNPVTSFTEILVGNVNEMTGRLVRAMALSGETDTSYVGYDATPARSFSDRTVVVGAVTSASTTRAVVALIRMDGTVVWAEALSSEIVGYSYQYYGCTGLNNGDYIAVGNGELAGHSVGVISRFNALGMHQSSRRFGSSGRECAYSVAPSRDGGYIVVSKSRSFGVSDSILAMKFNSVDELVFSVSIDGNKAEVPRRVTTTRDGGYLIVGTTTSFGYGTIKGCLIKLDSRGQLEWVRGYGKVGFTKDGVSDIVELPGGGLRMGGDGSSYTASSSTDMFMAQMGPEGSIHGHQSIVNLRSILLAKSVDVVLLSVNGHVQSVFMRSRDVTATIKWTPVQRSVHTFEKGGCTLNRFLYSPWPTEVPTIDPTGSPPTLIPSTSSPTTSTPSAQPSSSSPTTSCPTTSYPSSAPTTSAPTSSSPTSMPSSPSSPPTSNPSVLPGNPTPLPSLKPTSRPTSLPTAKPSRAPTVRPTVAPTAFPSTTPTTAPTTLKPSRIPSKNPTRVPSPDPSTSPTQRPTREPTVVPTTRPTTRPIHPPSSTPSLSTSCPSISSPSLEPTAEKKRRSAKDNDDWSMSNIFASSLLILVAATLLSCFLGLRSYFRWYLGEPDYGCGEIMFALYDSRKIKKERSRRLANVMVPVLPTENYEDDSAYRSAAAALEEGVATTEGFSTRRQMRRGTVMPTSRVVAVSSGDECFKTKKGRLGVLPVLEESSDSNFRNYGKNYQEDVCPETKFEWELAAVSSDSDSTDGVWSTLQKAPDKDATLLASFIKDTLMPSSSSSGGEVNEKDAEETAPWYRSSDIEPLKSFMSRTSVDTASISRSRAETLQSLINDFDLDSSDSDSAGSWSNEPSLPRPKYVNEVGEVLDMGTEKSDSTEGGGDHHIMSPTPVASSPDSRHEEVSSV